MVQLRVVTKWYTGEIGTGGHHLRWEWDIKMGMEGVWLLRKEQVGTLQLGKAMAKGAKVGLWAQWC